MLYSMFVLNKVNDQAFYCRTFLLDKGIIGSSLYACIQRSFHGCEMIFSQG